MGVRCPRCHSENTDTSRFCSSCAAPLGTDAQALPSVTKTMATPVAGLSKGSVIAGKYKIIEEIGRGGMGVVYKAEDIKLQRMVALKFLPAQWTTDPEARERFVQEARAASALDHPNICNIHEIEETEDGHMYIAMACYEGESLREKIKRGPLDKNEAFNIAIQVAQGMSKAHAKGIVHRDIKPANVLITRDGLAKIVDFGLAKLAGQVKLTREGTTVGTVAYMSPEQTQGEAVDQRTDIWSLGVVLYEMLSGVLPFKGDYDQTLIHSILNHDPERLAKFQKDLPAGLENVVFKALSKKPFDRYQSMDELLEDLKAIAEGLKPLRAKAGLFQSKILGIKKVYAYAGFASIIILAAAALLLKPWRGGKVSLSDANSVVVLPCKVYGDKAAEYLTEAIPGSLSTLLGTVEGLDTRAPITNAEFETAKGNLAKVAALYKVQHLVQSFVTVESDLMTLNVQLLDSKTRRILWSHEYPGQRSNYLELVHGTAEDLRRKLLPDSNPVATVSGLAAKSEAELFFRQAKYYTNRYHVVVQQADWDSAFSDLKRALDLDPKMADAAAGIAWLYIYKTWHTPLGDEAALAEAEAWARRAIEIDPRCGRAWSALSGFEMLSFPSNRYKQLEYALKAVRLAPLERESYGMLANSPLPGMLGLEAHIESFRLDSLDLPNGTSIGFTLFCYGRSAEGLRHVDAALSIEPDFSYGTWAKFFILADLGRLAEAADLLPKLQSQDWMYLLPQCALALQRADSTAADRLLKEILAHINDPKTTAIDVSTVAIDLLSFLVGHGRIEAALGILKRGLEVGIDTIYDMLILDPRLEPLRRDVRFKPILELYRNNCMEIMRIVAQAKSRGELPRFLHAPFVDLLKKLDIQL